MKTQPNLLSVSHEQVAGEPVLDTAVTHALLRRVARGEIGETLRLYVPENAVVFSLLDARRDGFGRAKQAARGLGYSSVLRLAGGHAAVFHPQCLAFSWAVPTDDASRGIHRRFDWISQWIRRGLNRLGVPAEVGLVPGEYCPGDYSVNAEGRVKLMGVGQRVVQGAAHLGGVLVVRDSHRTRQVLTPVYDALGLDWDPDTVGAVEDVLEGSNLKDVRQALLDELHTLRHIQVTPIDSQTHVLAQELLPWHSPDDNPRGRAVSLQPKVVGSDASLK